MTDAEVVATWMNSQQREWHWSPVDVGSLDRFYLIEDRLSDKQRKSYRMQAGVTGKNSEDFYWSLLHASPFVKIRAIAAVLRPEVEGASK